MIPSVAIMSVGFAAQIFFSARILVQWILSERAKQVLSPAIFWIFSICGSYLMCVYGWLRTDFSIIFGQFIAYYIYLWNLRMKGVMRKIPRPTRILLYVILYITPVVAAVAAIFSNPEPNAVFINFFANDDIPKWLIIYGSLGQFTFTMRFIYQWFYSYRKKESILPTGFWILSICGSLSIVIYGIIRHDIVLIIGQSFGLVAYIRNVFIGRIKKI